MPYFDYNATTPPRPAALEAARQAQEQTWHNPSSPYRAAARAHALLEDAREKLAAHLGDTSQNYIFTSGATEANNAVFAYCAQKYPANYRVVVSAIEHPSVLAAAQAWFPNRVSFIPISEQGVADVDSLRKIFRAGKIALVSLMAANNETGVLQPWAEVAEFCGTQGTLFHCDATQWLGKLPAKNLSACDFLTGSGHKMGGSKGAGFLKINSDVADFHIQFGGEQEHGHRAGTENLPAILSLVSAFTELTPQLSSSSASWSETRKQFEAAVKATLPGVSIIGEKSLRLWNTVMFIAPRHANHRWITALDKLGFQISTGSACATGREGPSHVLAAMSIDGDASHRALRVSGGWETPLSDWLALAAALGQASTRLDVE